MPNTVTLDKCDHHQLLTSSCRLRCHNISFCLPLLLGSFFCHCLSGSSVRTSLNNSMYQLRVAAHTLTLPVTTEPRMICSRQNGPEGNQAGEQHVCMEGSDSCTFGRGLFLPMPTAQGRVCIPLSPTNAVISWWFVSTNVKVIFPPVFLHFCGPAGSLALLFRQDCFTAGLLSRLADAWPQQRACPS